MLRTSPRLCNLCNSQLLTLFTNGFALPIRVSRHGGKSGLLNKSHHANLALSRSFAISTRLKATVEHDGIQDDNASTSSAQMEAIVRQARQTFGETLPENFLSSEEYQLYERLYGPPSAMTLPEDVDMLKEFEDEEDQLERPVGTEKLNVLMREDRDGNLEEVVFEDDPEDELDEIDEEEVSEKSSGAELEVEFSDEDIIVELERIGKQEGAIEEDAVTPIKSRSEKQFQARMKTLHETFAANRLARGALMEEGENAVGEELVQEPEKKSPETMEQLDEDFEDDGTEYERSETVRAHPLTSAGHSGTSPSTLQLPKESFVDPITTLLADASNSQLSEMAHKTFGGPGLPHSTATIRRPNLVQQNIPLEASQFRMGGMESNAYLAAMYPGAYASVMSTLIEVRKRLGSDWLRGLMSQPAGPRILDAGSGGAAVLAWREVIAAEYDIMNLSAFSETRSPPFGKSTVVTGSQALRHHASALLDNTSFIPRLPDYDPSRDHPSLEASNPQPRKQYDIVIAPYTLWSLKEDHMRKSQVQNFWSLLDPRGGVLILIEKGVPRGFELIAGARDTILKHHISSPKSEDVVENLIDSGNQNRFSSKEEGMIIAPCTNHGKCPMYIEAGKSQGRKDFCHFTQRFIRPPYLQRILGQKEKNHEDISFSYVAFRRGQDLRETEPFVQGKPAADAAFEGYEDYNDGQADAGSDVGSIRAPNPLSMPRAILPPIKRRGHVILDLCTPAGKIERWTVPKSFSKQAYRDARKSKWGDLWALGAKTRVERKVRVGLKRQRVGREGKRKGGMDEGDGDDGDEGLEDGTNGIGEGMDDGAKSKRSKRPDKRTRAAMRKEQIGRSGRAKYPQQESMRMSDEG